MGEWHDDKDFPKRSPMTDLTEQIAEWLRGHDRRRRSAVGSCDPRDEAKAELQFLSSLGLVQLYEGADRLPPYDGRKYLDRIKAAGFRRVHSLLPQEKGKMSDKPITTCLEINRLSIEETT